MTERQPDIPDISKIKCEDCRYSVDNVNEERPKMRFCAIRMENLIGTRMKLLLHSHCMTQQDLADKAGTTPVTIGRYLSGQRIPNALMLKKIADILHAPTDYFLNENYAGMLERPHRDWLESVLKMNDELACTSKGKSLDPNDIFMQSIAQCLADIADMMTNQKGDQNNGGEQDG